MITPFSERETALAVQISQWQRKYGDTFALLGKAELRIAELEAEIERLKNPHGAVIADFIERNWKK